MTYTPILLSQKGNRSLLKLEGYKSTPFAIVKGFDGEEWYSGEYYQTLEEAFEDFHAELTPTPEEDEEPEDEEDEEFSEADYDALAKGGKRHV